MNISIEGFENPNSSDIIIFSKNELIFKDLKSLFETRGFIINWKGLEKQSLDETINALAMASPFTVEEKQVLLEAKNLDTRKTKIAEILKLDNIKANVEVIFQTVKGLHIACPKNLGDWYFTGDYPTPGGCRVVNQAFINFVEKNNERAY